MNWKKLTTFNFDWTLIAFGYIAIKSSIVRGIHWAEVFGIVIVLCIYYLRSLIPQRKTLVQYEEDFFGMLKDMDSKIKLLNQELSNIKLMLGVRKERGLK